MNTDEMESVPLQGGVDIDWPTELHSVFRRAGVGHVSYVPDAGHTALINLCIADEIIVTNVLTTEEEGVAIATGAWLGGTRAAILMQSSGVGNCINMLSLPVIARVPLLMLVTMRGEWVHVWKFLGLVQVSNITVIHW